MSISVVKIKESPLFWPVRLSRNAIVILDETALPAKTVYIKAKDVKDAVKAIRQMKTRAFGQFLVVLNTFLLELDKAGSKHKQPEQLLSLLGDIAEKVENSRPTFPFKEVTSMCLGWGMQAIKQDEDFVKFVRMRILGYMEVIRQRRLDRVRRIADIISDGDKVLTHCNVSGELAMAAWLCMQQGKVVRYFATETRPYMQGAKLTCWELKKMGADVTLVADNAVGSLMADGLVNKVIVGSDRCCANGDFANKIGTYQIAVLAKEFAIPFYALIQPSKMVPSGDDIPVEIRSADELLRFEGRKIVRGNVDAFYPAFDVIPKRYLTGGVIEIEIG